MPVNSVKYLYTRGGVVRAGYNKFPMVEFINASSSSLIDLYVLNNCKELKNIILSFTYVTDISPLLEYNKKLENIDLSFSYA
jgi:Leucine-rich repeat (LRR) protein